MHRDHGMGLGAILFFEHFCCFFRSLALVFQKSPTRNKEATRFTLNLFLNPSHQSSGDFGVAWEGVEGGGRRGGEKHSADLTSQLSGVSSSTHRQCHHDLYARWPSQQCKRIL